MNPLPKKVDVNGATVWEVCTSVDGYSVRYADGRTRGQWPTPEAAAKHAEGNG